MLSADKKNNNIFNGKHLLTLHQQATYSFFYIFVSISNMFVLKKYFLTPSGFKVLSTLFLKIYIYIYIYIFAAFLCYLTCKTNQQECYY